MLGFAFLLPFLTWVQAAGAALLALFFNLFVLPRLEIDLRKRTRDQVSPEVWTGIVIYPLSVLLLILFYRHSMEIVAAVWAIMALGDGSAGVAGGLMKGPPLPWNRDKSWPGFIAFALAGTLGAFALMRWVAPAMPADQAWLSCAATAMVGATVESLPIALDDNLTVPFVAGAFLFGVSFIEASSFWSNYPYLKSRLLWALAVNLAFALAAHPPPPAAALSSRLFCCTGCYDWCRKAAAPAAVRSLSGYGHMPGLKRDTAMSRLFSSARAMAFSIDKYNLPSRTSDLSRSELLNLAGGT